MLGLWHQLIRWLDAWGQHGALADSLYNRRVVVVRMLFFALLVTPFLLLLPNKDNSVLYVSFAAVSISFVLIGLGYFLLARWTLWFMMFIVLAYFYTSTVATHAAYWSGQLLYLAFVVIPFVLFDVRERWSLTITTLLNILIYFLYSALVQQLSNKDISMFAPYAVIHITNLLAGLIILLPGILFFISEHHRTLATNQNLLQLAEENAQELRASLDTIQLQAQDIEDRKVIEEKLRLAKAQAEDAYAELRNTRNQLALSEKLAVLGELVAGITHEINNPVAAIRSQAVVLRDSLASALAELRHLSAKLTPPENAAFDAVQRRSLQAQALASTREERALRKKIAEELEKHTIAASEDRAQQLVELGIHQLDEQVLLLLRGPNAAVGMKTLLAIKVASQGVVTILNSIERTMGLLQAIKKYAHTQHSPDAQTVVSLAENIGSIAILFAYQIRKKGDLVMELDPAATVLGNSDKLSQVWTNLITNALQAMEQGTMSITAKVVGTQAVVQVVDTGKGIPPEVLPRIFDSFFTTKAKGEGTGMGLHITKQIVEGMQGSIVAESQPGRTVFTVRFPQHNGHPAA